MINVSDRSYVVKNIKTYLCSITFFPRKSCRLWDNVVEADFQKIPVSEAASERYFAFQSFPFFTWTENIALNHCIIASTLLLIVRTMSGIFPSRGKKCLPFPNGQDRYLNPSSLLFSGCRVLFHLLSGLVVNLTTSVHPVPRLRMRGAITPLHPSTPS